MTLPVSSYEELLARMRSLKTETIQLHQEISTSLCDGPSIGTDTADFKKGFAYIKGNYATYPKKKSSGNEEQFDIHNMLSVQQSSTNISTKPFGRKEEEIDDELKEIDEKNVQDALCNNSLSYRRDWGPESLGLWHSGPSKLSLGSTFNSGTGHEDPPKEFTASLCAMEEPSIALASSSRSYSHQQLGAKVEMVYNLLSMLDTSNHSDMSKTFLAMSSSPESCQAMRQSGCLPLLVQLIHSSEQDAAVRNRAAQALYNIVHAQGDDNRKRREIRVLKLLQQLREYCDLLKSVSVEKKKSEENADEDNHPIASMGALMKFSFDAEHRQAICTLGGLHAIAELIQVDHEDHGSNGGDSTCLTLRKYAVMSLTNLTFGDGKNKALLCSFNKFMCALVDLLKSPSEDLRQGTASVLRNLSWRADSESKQTLRDVGAVNALTVAGMEGTKESTLKSILSALWNLSGHCSENKEDICSVPGALAFLVRMLRYKSTSNTLAIVENAGGIIRNISSHISVREDYREILRENNCFEILLEQLKSPSLTIVSNACGTLWNLSARCSEDQKKLWEMGATSMLRNLVQSKHKMISMGSSAALKNLLTANPKGVLLPNLDSTAKNLGFQNLPTLFVRKQRALEQEIDITLAETCDNLDCNVSPCHREKSGTQMDTSFSSAHSDSRESVISTKSDSVCERLSAMTAKQQNHVLDNKCLALHESLNEKERTEKAEQRKLMKRYKTSMIPTLANKTRSHESKNSIKPKEETAVDEILQGSFESGGSSSTSIEEVDKPKRGIPILKTRTRNKMSSGTDAVGQSSIASKQFSFKRNDELNSSTDYAKTKAQNISPSQKNGKSLSEHSASAQMDGWHPKEMRECRSQTNDETMVFAQDSATCEDTIETARNKHSCTNSQNSGFADSITSTLSLPHSKTCAGLTNCDAEYIPKPPMDVSLTKCSTNPMDPTDPAVKYRDETMLTTNDKSAIDNVDSPTLTGSKKMFEAGNKGFRLRPCDNNNEQLEEVNESGSTTDISNSPNFKVGSEIRNHDFFRTEANIICREIRKYQDTDMGCSLNSQTSALSCSSFLDAGDYSLFELSNEVADLDELELTANKDKGMQVNCFASHKKPIMCSSNDFVSLPSLGSLKNDQIDTMDLESSMISVASLTSEVADTNLISGSENHKGILQPCSFGSICGTVEIDDEDDNTLNSQENIPSDCETFKDFSLGDTKKKMTARERRKAVQDRYRTYTIRDFKANCTRESNNEGDLAVARGASSPERTPKASGPLADLGDCVAAVRQQDYVAQLPHFTPLSSDTFKANEDAIESVRGRLFTSITESKSLDDLLNVGPAERKELADNAKLVALSLKSASNEYDPELSIISCSEVEFSMGTHEIDTATYRKDQRTDFRKFSNVRYGDSARESTDCEVTLVKNSQSEVKSELKQVNLKDFSNGLDGRKKQLCSSPLRKVASGIVSSPNSPKTWANSKKLNMPSTKSLPNVAKCISNSSTPHAIQREGTFTKIGDSKLAKPNSSTRDLRFADKHVDTRQIKPRVERKIDGGKSISCKTSSPTHQNNVASNANTVSEKGKLKNPKKEVSSKIASLWKKVEETREKNKNVKDNRVWIGPEKNVKPSRGEVTHVDQRSKLLDGQSRKSFTHPQSIYHKGE